MVTKTEKKLDFTGVETFTTNTYYDIVNGYFTSEIKDEYTKKKLIEAIKVITKLESYLQDNDLIG